MSVRILVGDVREQLATLPEESVHCVVTSPPYWGLRDYGTAAWSGGDADCEHSVGGQVQDGKAPVAIVAGVRPGVDASRCRVCGATRIDSQLGLEPTPDEYVAAMVGVFRDVRRVLRSDGTLWLNMGDCYASSVNGTKHGDTQTGFNAGYFGKDYEDGKQGGAAKARPRDDRTFRDKPFSTIGHGIKPKDLVGMPWRLAFALQADGWWLRCDIVWSKPNPMPESVTDRPTKSHEYLFLLAKSARYYYDAEAIREADRGFETFHHGAYDPPGGNGSEHGAPAVIRTGRNRRSVWTIATQPYPEAHFATYPEALVEPCILAGTSAKGCCSECVAPWERVTERVTERGTQRGTQPSQSRANLKPPQQSDIMGRTISLGWKPSCAHVGIPVRATVLDPFAGSGTTLAVANRLDRNAIGIELNPAYAQLAERRIAKTAPQIALDLPA